MSLPILYQDIATRADAIADAHGDWPCHKGCDDCCRSLAEPLRLPRTEWRQLEDALSRLPAPERELIEQRLREAAEKTSPSATRICPFLNRDKGACRVYDARPTACRSYGFYQGGDGGRFCGKIEKLEDVAEIVWGNHDAVERRLESLAGEAIPLSRWLLED